MKKRKKYARACNEALMERHDQEAAKMRKKGYVTVPEVHRRTGWSLPTIYRHLREGVIKGKRMMVGRQVRVWVSLKSFKSIKRVR